MTVDEVAEHLGIGRNTVYRHSEKNRLFVDQVRAETEAIAAKTIAKRITELESKADIKQRMSAKAYQRLEALLERTEDDGLTLSALKEALDRTEGKAIDRKQIHQLSEHKETVTHQISEETIARLSAFMARPAHQPLIAAAQVIDVEPQPAN
jgi:transposase